MEPGGEEKDVQYTHQEMGLMVAYKILGPL